MWVVEMLINFYICFPIVQEIKQGVGQKLSIWHEDLRRQRELLEYITLSLDTGITVHDRGVVLCLEDSNEEIPDVLNKQMASKFFILLDQVRLQVDYTQASTLSTASQRVYASRSFKLHMASPDHG